MSRDQPSITTPVAPRLRALMVMSSPRPRMGPRRTAADGHFARLQIVERPQHQSERAVGQFAGAGLGLPNVVVGLEHRHRAPDDDHVVPQGLDLRRQELVPVAEKIESVANHGGEQLTTGQCEELFVRSPGRRHVGYACYLSTQAESTREQAPAIVMTL